MTTYTMNGQQHPTMQIQPDILAGMAGNLAAQLRRSRRRLRALPEQFSCLDSPDPRVQLQEALKQIEFLLQENSQLVETVYLLGRALKNAHSLIHNDVSMGQSERDKLQLSHDCTE